MLVEASKAVLPGGFTVLDAVFSEPNLEAGRQALAGLRRGETNLKPAFPWPEARVSEARSYKFPGASHLRSEVAVLARSPELGARIALATGARTVRFWFDQILHEEPSPADRPLRYHWHTERSRWKTCRSPLMVTAWIPLAPVTLAMGPLTVARHSARAGWLDLPPGWRPEENDRLALPLAAGSALLFCWHTVHGNPPNFGDRPRQVLAAHFALDSLAYRARGNFAHLNERAVRQAQGSPDFADEAVCPVIFG